MSQQDSAITLADGDIQAMSKVETLKTQSQGLFWVGGETGHPVADDVDALTAGQAETLGKEAAGVAKHYGIYTQRERNERGGKTGDFIFMVRTKIPAGGELSASQWRALDQAADYGDGSLRLTTRQDIQFHFVPGRYLAPLIQVINREAATGGAGLTTLGACGDVSRNVVLSPATDLDPELPLALHDTAYTISKALLPQSSAYYQVFLSDGEGRKVAPLQGDEPFYGGHYLPRKFKVGIAHPRDNGVDLLTNDVGFMPVVEAGEMAAWDLYSGGGLGMTHNQPHTKPLLAQYLGRIPLDQATAAVKAIATLQKEHGERRDRQQARWKYTLRRLGLDTVKAELRDRFEIPLTDAQPQPLAVGAYHFGWHRQADGQWYLGLPVENGRLQDQGPKQLRSGLRAVVEQVACALRITPNQDLLLCHIDEADCDQVESLLRQHGVPLPDTGRRLRQQALACPAKPTCGLAMTHGERLLPRYIQALEEAELGDTDVVIRLAGCPNGCSRAATAEIGIYGYGKDRYVLQVGGSRYGTALGKTLYERLSEEETERVLLALVRALRERTPSAMTPGEYLQQVSLEELDAWVDHYRQVA